MTRRLARASRVLVAAVALIATSTSCVLFEYVSGVRDGCTEWTTTVAFDDASGVLRGTWRGIVSDHPTEGTDAEVTLYLTASFVDDRSYAVAGTFVLGDSEPLVLEGTVSGRCGERYVAGAPGADVVLEASEGFEAGVASASIPPPASLLAEVRDASGVLTWSIVAAWGDSSGWPSLESGELTARIRSDVDLGGGLAHERTVALVRVDAP